MKVEFSVGIGRHYEREVIEFDADTTDEELQEYYNDWTVNHIDGHYHKVED